MELQLIDTRRPRTHFVDVLAGAVLAAAGAGALVCLPRGAWYETLAAPRAGAGAELEGAALQAFLGLWPAIAAALLLFFVLGLVAGVGLLRRRNWARVLLQGLLVLGAAASLGVLGLQAWLGWHLTLLPAPAPGGLDAAALRNLDWMRGMLRAALDFFALGFAATCGWLIHHLNSRTVRAEFSPGRGPA
jgi:hypothetical protein